MTRNCSKFTLAENSELLVRLPQDIHVSCLKERELKGDTWRGGSRVGGRGDDGG